MAYLCLSIFRPHLLIAILYFSVTTFAHVRKYVSVDLKYNHSLMG